MGNMKAALEAKAEMALRGNMVYVDNDSEVEFMTDYIRTVLQDTVQTFDIFDRIRKYNEDNVVKYIGTCRVLGMPCIIYAISNPRNEVPEPFSDDYGSGYPVAFCYVYNLTYDEMCSEFGDVAFKSYGPFYRRAC